MIDSGIVSAHAQVANNRLAITVPPCAMRGNVFIDITPCVFFCFCVQAMPYVALNLGQPQRRGYCPPRKTRKALHSELGECLENLGRFISKAHFYGIRHCIAKNRTIPGKNHQRASYYLLEISALLPTFSALLFKFLANSSTSPMEHIPLCTRPETCLSAPRWPVSCSVVAPQKLPSRRNTLVTAVGNN
ncbi:hypothetical protein D3C73_1154160 [compost metagenome]